MKNWKDKLNHLTTKQLRRRIVLLYILVILILCVAFVIGKISLLETAIALILLALCLPPVFRL